MVQSANVLFIDLTMTSGFSAIAGSVFSAYISLGVPAQNLVTSSVMSIPASIAISKIRLPELDEPVTRGHVVVDRGENQKNAPVSTPIQSRQFILINHTARQMPSTLLVKALFSVLSSPVRFCRSHMPRADAERRLIPFS